MTNLKPPSIYRVIVAQLAWTVLLSIAGLMAFEVVFGYSALLGGLISALPNSYFALHAFRYQGAQNAHKVVKGFIRGELGKIVFTGMLFALSFTLVTSLNEFALTYANNAQEMRLMQDKLLKSGQLSLKDYNIGRANLTQGTTQLFDLSKKYQDAQHNEKVE